MKRLVKGLTDFLQKSFKADPNARALVVSIMTKADGSETVALAASPNYQSVADSTGVVDVLLCHISETIRRGLHPDCVSCREYLKRIEATRAALGIENRPERTS
jgi:hypothetical protein